MTTRPPFEYDAFLSYSSRPDEKLVRRTKNFLAGFHRQWLLRALHLRPLEVCLDGQNFKLRSGDTLVPVEETLRPYVTQSRCLVVFCSTGAVKSTYVDREIAMFLEGRPPSAILPVVTEGDPGVAPEQVFPKTLIAHGLHKAIWLDFRGHSPIFWRRPKVRFRPFGEERAKLAAELHDRAPNILPAWKRAQATRRGLAIAGALCVAMIGAVALTAARRNQALRMADSVVQEIRSGSRASIGDLQARAAEAAATFHVFETDVAYREAASLSIRRIDLSNQPLRGSHALAGNGRLTIRLAGEAIETTDDPRTGIWTRAIPGTLAHFDSSQDGSTIAAVEKNGGLLIWRAGTTLHCSGVPADSVGRAVALEPAGQRVALLLQSARGWSLALGDPASCGTQPLTVHSLWSAGEAGDEGGTLLSAPRPDRVRARLSLGGRAVIVSSEERWLLARLADDGHAIEPLNQVLEEAWRTDVVALPTGRESWIAIADEAFSADGQYAAVAAVRTDDVRESAGPSTLLISLSGAPRPIIVNASRGSRRLAMAKTRSQLAFMSGTYVRVWDWSSGVEISRTPLPRGGVGALEFVAADRLLLMADRDTQPHLHVSDAPTGMRLGQVDASGIVSMSSGGPDSDTLLARSGEETELYELQTPSTVARFRKSSAKGASGTAAGVLVMTTEGPLLHCAAASTQCVEQRGPAPTGNSANVLATSDGTSLHRRGSGACVASTREPDACHPISAGERAISAGAVSSSGSAVAVAVRIDAGSSIEIYQRSLVRWFPWPTWEYVRQATIDDPGDVQALGFSADAAWIASASDWRTEFVVRRFPVTASAMATNGQRE